MGLYNILWSRIRLPSPWWFALQDERTGVAMVVNFLLEGRTGWWRDDCGEVSKGDQQKAEWVLVLKGEKQNVGESPSTSLMVPSWPLVGSCHGLSLASSQTQHNYFLTVPPTPGSRVENWRSRGKETHRLR